MSYKVTVIIPTYNAAKFIKETVNSVMSQTIGFENIELIIVDDNSTDATKDILIEYSKDYDNIKCYFPKGNSGTPGRGRNIGIDNASADYLMFLDQDDRYVNNMCEVLLDVIQKTGNDLAMCNYKTINNSNFNLIEDINMDTSYVVCNPTHNEILFSTGYMWLKIFKKEFLDKFNIRCFDKYWCEDIYFSVKSYLNTNKITYLKNYEGYLYNVRDNPNDSSSINSYDVDDFNKHLMGFYEIIALIKKFKRQDLINYIMKVHFVNILSLFVKLDNNTMKYDLLNDIYEFKEYCNFNNQLDEKWADILLKLISKRKFKLIIFYSKILNIIYNSQTIRRVYRNFYDKI